MDRIAMTDGSGRWFDRDSADKFEEGMFWDGNNNISMATHSQTEHEELYRTASGKWVLNCWSQWQGVLETYEIVDDDFAAKWLVTNEHDSEVVKDQIAELEI